jgi:hypothetical protein
MYRIWKTNASAKLGPIDTRERQSMEYRRKLREKWGNEKGVREIERYVVYHRYLSLSDQSLCMSPSCIDNVVCLRTSRTQQRSRRPCWMRERPRTRIEDGIHAKVWSSRRPRGRVSVNHYGEKRRFLTVGFVHRGHGCRAALDRCRWCSSDALMRLCIILSRCIAPPFARISPQALHPAIL